MEWQRVLNTAQVRRLACSGHMEKEISFNVTNDHFQMGNVSILENKENMHRKSLYG